MHSASPKLQLLAVARPSNLSRRQVVEVERMIHHFYPEVQLCVHYLKSQGDCDKVSSLRGLECSNFFTDSLDRALINGTLINGTLTEGTLSETGTRACAPVRTPVRERVRMAIHSAKDLPSPLAPQLQIAAITPCIDERDALVLRSGLDPSQPLPSGLRIATSSTRRETAARTLAPSPIFQDLRGTIEERLSLLDANCTHGVDGVVVAEAALIRLQLTHLPRLYLPGPTVEGQGSLAIVVRADDKELLHLLSIFDSRQDRPRSYYLGIDPTGYKNPFPLIHSPLIQTRSLLDETTLDETSLKETSKETSKETGEALNSLRLYYERCSHILLTSPRAAQYLISALRASPRMVELAKSKIWLCIGPSTAAALPPEAIERHVCPDGSCAEDLLPLLQEVQKAKGSALLYPHSELARPLLKNSLIELGIDHFSLSIYQTSPRELASQELESLRRADELIITSPSCASSLFAQLKSLPTSCKITPIGRVTELALQKYQLPGYTASY